MTNGKRGAARRAALAAPLLVLAACAGPRQRDELDDTCGPLGGPAAPPARGPMDGVARDLDPGLRAARGMDRLRVMLGQQYRAALDATARELNLDPAQSPAWQRYAGEVAQLVGDLLRLQPEPAARKTALQDIGDRVDRVRNRLAAMEAVNDAARDLYAVLRPEQRTVADRILVRTVPNLYGDLVDGPGGGMPGGDGRGQPGRGRQGGPDGGPGRRSL